ncbi:MAG: MFS transporter, partial [Myxococcales bacterium]|nr:MFS transporter [Myxococcales bacterium]
DALVPLWIVVFMYMLHTTGELFLSPIGLSMVTKLAPKTMTGTVMGAWFLSFSLSNKVAGKLAGLTGSGEGGVETADMTPIDSLTTYLDVFGTMGYVLVAFGVFVALLSRPINRLMHGVR